MEQVELIGEKKFQINNVPIPDIAEDEVLLRVWAVGICGSDIHAYYGRHPFMSFPIVLGHEAAGEIVKVGKAVLSATVGERVVYRPQKVCGTCFQCKEGRYNICKELEVWGCQDTGASSMYYAVKSDLVYKIPANMT